jgi:hypothetical protein
LTAAYWTYGPVLVRLLQLDSHRQTPAVELRDGVDYDPLAPNELLSQHFSAIAAAGPIVGPILAGVTFGWVPALIWILVGCIFVGGVHDFTSLVASIRHKARSIAEVVRDLFRSESQPEQSYSERQLYEAALDRMSREISSVSKISDTEAVRQIEQNLAKSPRRGVPPVEGKDAKADAKAA